MQKIIIMFLTVSFLLAGCSLTAPATPSRPNDAQPNVAQPNGQKPSDQTNLPEPSGAKLDLSGQKLKKVPAYVFDLSGLEELNLANNQLEGAIQAEIRQLRNLKSLNASNNLMTGVPAEIGQLSNLEILDLSNNQLTGLPYELGNLKNLKIFNLSGNNYSETDLNIIKSKLPASVNIIK